MKNQIFSRLSTHNWLINVTLMCFLLGALLAANLNTQGSIREKLGMEAAGPGGRMPYLVEALKAQRRTIDDLNVTINDLRAKAAKKEEEFAQRSEQSGVIARELNDLKFQAGLTAVQGPGLVVRLEDNKEKPFKGEEAMATIVHDYDLRNVVNELYAAGAEAVSVNDHRLISRSAIRCVGPIVLINREASASPFEIRAVGNPRDLESALTIPGGVIDQIRMGVMAGQSPMGPHVTIARSGNVTIPPYSGPTNTKYARPVPLKG